MTSSDESERPISDRYVWAFETRTAVPADEETAQALEAVMAPAVRAAAARKGGGA